MNNQFQEPKKVKSEFQEPTNFIERIWERGLWASRLIVLLAVFFSIVAAISLFILGSWEIVTAILDKNPITNRPEIEDHFEMLQYMISAIDLYLIGVVLLVFGFGIYELFISKIDVARQNEASSILEVENLDELKNKLIKVIIMVLVVSFFESILKHAKHFSEPQDLLMFAVSIFAISLGIYFVNKK